MFIVNTYDLNRSIYSYSAYFIVIFMHIIVRASWRFPLFWGQSGTFRWEHSVEDHHLHINGIFFFWGGGGRLPQNGPPESPE